MTVICAWCGGGMGEKPGPANEVSHGICQPCAAMVMAEMDGADAANIGPGAVKPANGERVNL